MKLTKQQIMYEYLLLAQQLNEISQELGGGLTKRSKKLVNYFEKKIGRNK